MDMGIVGHVESLWRYPVKSMRGEELAEAFIGFAGVYGDRLYAFKSSTRPAGFPYLTGREQEAMLLYRPRFRHPDQAAKPPNLAEAEAIAPGITPLPGDPAALAVEVETPAGEVLAVDDPTLTHKLGEGSPDDRVLTLLRSERAMTDCRPISLFSMQTARQLAEEIGIALDQRRFRANVYLDLSNTAGFAEDGFVGRRLRLGPKAVVAVLERDPRCKMITLDPDTAKPSPDILRKVTRAHEGMAGVYGAVLVEGTVHPGDPIELLD
jgi:MOSC domain-containing protein